MTGDRGFGRGQHPDELLSASLTGDLTPAERAQLDDHLAGCAQCRETLSAFAEERRLIGGLREVTPPRDLGARVRAGIEGRGPAGGRWWQRPGPLVGAFATLATITAALLAVVVFSNLDRGPIGATNSPEASASAVASEDIRPTATQLPSVAPTVAATPEPPVALEPGQVGYLQLDGEPRASLDLGFVNDATGEVTDLGTASAAPWRAAISPTNEFVAYTVDVGLSGAQQLRVTRLADGSTAVLGCTMPTAFADRLAWSDDGHYLAYTLRPIDLGGSVDCGGVTGDGSGSDAWIYDAAGSGVATRLTEVGNAFVADFGHGTAELLYPLLVSYAAAQPYTEIIGVATDREPTRIDDVFLPLLAPTGETALFWQGQMEQTADGGWRFILGGLPYVSSSESSPWEGEPFFPDLLPVGGAAFESGQFGWSPDGLLIGFWLGEWTGPPQSDNDSRPTAQDLYVRQVIGGSPDALQHVPLALEELQGIVDVALDGTRATVLVTVVQPSAGDLATPASTLYAVPLDGAEPRILGTGASWTGPAVIGLEAVPIAP